MDAQLMKDLIYTLMQGRQTVTTALHDSELSLAEFTALARIEKNKIDSSENVYADDLQRCLYVSKPAISQMLKSLEKSGYIKREINLANRRKLTVILTEQGRKVLRKATQRYKNAITQIVDRFGIEKTRQLIALYSEFATVAGDVRKTQIASDD